MGESDSDDQGGGCPVHDGQFHGGEAEELRAGVEHIIADCSDNGETGIAHDLQELIDRVDARDSLAHLERSDVIAALRTELADVRLARDHAVLQAQRMGEALERMRMPSQPRETTASISIWADDTFGVPPDNMSIYERAKLEFEELGAKLSADDNHPDAPVEIADIRIVLERITHRFGRDGRLEVDAKMRINRARKWRMTSPGHGQHVEDES